MNHYDAAADALHYTPVSTDALAVCEAILAVADRVEALTAAARALIDTTMETAAAPAQTDYPRPPVVCPGCSTVHMDPGMLCDTCASAGPA